MSLLSLTSARWTWGVLCWGDRLTAGFADVLRHSPLFWEGHSRAQLSFLPSWRWGRRWGTCRKEIYPSRFVAWVECIVVSRRVGRLPTVEGAYYHWSRRYWGWFWRLWWLRTIVVIICISSIICNVRYWKDWAAGSSRSGLEGQSGVAVQNHRVSLAR